MQVRIHIWHIYRFYTYKYLTRDLRDVNNFEVILLTY